LRQACAGAQVVSDAWCQATYAAGAASLAALERDPAPLAQWLHQRPSRRLGVYFESLLAYWLQRILGVEPLHMNVPVYRTPPTAAGNTLGEFDFLFTLPGERMARHWEVAVKFYLQHRDDRGEGRWVGPAGQDRLDVKLARLCEHQLRLAHSPEGGALLARLGIDHVRPEVFIKGWLFYPLSSPLYSPLYSPLSSPLTTPLSTPLIMPVPAVADWLSERHLRGWWLTVAALTAWQPPPASRWCVLPRERWLAPVIVAAEAGHELLEGAALQALCAAHFAAADDALLVVELHRSASGWFEASRGFVVSAAWPGGAGMPTSAV
jgi:hypothetical protein